MAWGWAGIKQNAWLTHMERDGEDLYPLLRERAAIPEIYEQDPVRFEVMLRLGAFVTESSGHFSEYVPYFRKRPDLLARYVRAGYLGESGFYANNWPRWRRENDERIHSMLSGEAEIPKATRHEYASWIIEAIECGRPTSIHGNVVNDRAIQNPASRGRVEGECRVSAEGMQPLRFGPKPKQLAPLNPSPLPLPARVVGALLER